MNILNVCVYVCAICNSEKVLREFKAKNRIKQKCMSTVFVFKIYDFVQSLDERIK